MEVHTLVHAKVIVTTSNGLQSNTPTTKDYHSGRIQRCETISVPNVFKILFSEDLQRLIKLVGQETL